MNGDSEGKAPSSNVFVFLDIAFGNVKGGRVVIELFKDVAPRTVENFRALCTGEKGMGRNGKPLHYKGSTFHRVVSMFMVQAGDIVNRDGTGGESIYGDKFDDENYNLTHSEEGIVGMANSGSNTNSSQFYITTVPCMHMDGLNVAFGKVRKGFNIIVEMADYPREDDIPIEPIVITNCGEFQPHQSWAIEENDGTEDIFPPWPNDWEMDVKSNARAIEDAINKIKNSGNYYFKGNNFLDSERKYKKALRYIDWYKGIETEYNCGKIDKLRLNSLLNLAATRIKRQKFKEAEDLCNQVLLLKPRNGKALYRRAQAKLGQTNYDEALEDLRLASSLYPNDRNIQSLLQAVKKKKMSYLKIEKVLFANLFK